MLFPPRIRPVIRQESRSSPSVRQEDVRRGDELLCSIPPFINLDQKVHLVRGIEVESNGRIVKDWSEQCGEIYRIGVRREGGDV